jgi:hypothetical protein
MMANSKRRLCAFFTTNAARWQDNTAPRDEKNRALNSELIFENHSK